MTKTQSNTMTVTGEGPYAGWDFTVTRHEHDIDPMDDLYTIDLWPPDANQPAHTFATYRHAYGFKTINAALAAANIRVDASMHAAITWWTHHHTSTPYEIHRILVAIDETTWATRDEIAHRLSLNLNHIEPGTPYGDALQAAQRHGLVTWRTKSSTPYAALTADGYDHIHPDNQPASDASQQRLTAVLATDQHGQSTPEPPAAGRAFPPISSVPASVGHPGGLGMPSPAPTLIRQTQPAR